MRYSIMFLALTCGLVACANASDKVCTREEAIQAETESSTLKDWDSVYQAFKRFGHCDDGAIGEGYSDSIARLLASDWAHIEKANTLTSSDKKFRRFVLHHIDELMSPDQWRMISENARDHCPTSAARLCKLIESRLSEVDQNIRRRKIPELKGSE
jgi:hypothetical protein